MVGGQAPKAIRSVEIYDFEEQRWHQVAELPTRRCRAGRKASVPEGALYLVGCVFEKGRLKSNLDLFEIFK